MAIRHSLQIHLAVNTILDGASALTDITIDDDPVLNTALSRETGILLKCVEQLMEIADASR